MMLPTSVIKADLGIEKNGKVQKYFTKRVADYMDKYVPLGDTGLLRNTIEIGDNYVLFKSNYAHYLYKGILYVDAETGSSYARKDTKKVPTSINLKYHTAGTGSYWDKKMMSAEGDDLVKEVENYIRR